MILQGGRARCGGGVRARLDVAEAREVGAMARDAHGPAGVDPLEEELLHLRNEKDVSLH